MTWAVEEGLADGRGNCAALRRRPRAAFAAFPETGLKPSFVRWLFQGRLLS